MAHLLQHFGPWHFPIMFARRWRDSHHGSREFVRWGSDDLRRPSVIALRVTGRRRKYYARGGRATKESFSQRDWRGGHGSEQGRQHDVIVQTPVHEFDDSGSKATPRKRLVKKSGDKERTPDFRIEYEEPAFMRDEFASEPPSSQKRKGSKEDGFRKKEKKLKGDKKFDKGGKMSSKGGSLSAIYPWPRSRDEGVSGYGCGRISRMTKKVLGLWMTITS
ncbi:hypothetical protein Scep_021331 [Stephania cephalantha]|uniref:Uncharacterized protein n=1 Tax=Stephania cephalantha TaxID=152367 RepID=A0AAP0I051_9MAGN